MGRQRGTARRRSNIHCPRDWTYFARWRGRGGLVQLVAQETPRGKELVHMGDEGVIVAASQEMNHFVDDDVLEAARPGAFRRPVRVGR